MNERVELLAPAGNMDALKAAVAGGCDAIYLGLKSFSARAFAGNFSHEEFIEAIHYCHIRNVRIYVTINTMLFETEIENAFKEVDFLYENDVDGLIVQDLGLFHYCRTCYPDLDLHCSTQMHVHNAAGAMFMKEQGASRVVLARETPIENIKEITSMGIEVEAFVYGAICISYSGQCLMSQSMKNRSANRGVCAQCCRLKYFPIDQDHFKEGDYILSPKDLNLIEKIPELIEAGVRSFKIEGRMKRPEYVWIVTKTFREAIDAYYAGKSYHVTRQRIDELKLMFNRGFSNGHIFRDEVKERMSYYRPNHQGLEIGTVIQYRDGRVKVKLTDTLHQHDGLRIINEPTDTGLTAVRIYNERNELVNKAEKGDVVWLDCKSKPHPRPNQKLHKTSDTDLIERIDQEIEKDRKLPVRVHYEAFIDQPLTVTIEDERGNSVTSFSDFILEKAAKAPVTKEKIEQNLSRINDLPYFIEQMEGEIEEIFVPVSVINDTRRKAFDALNQQRETLHVRQGVQPYSFTLEEKNLSDLNRVLIESVKPIEYNGNISYTRGNGDHHVLPVINQELKTKEVRNDCILSSVGDLYGDNHNCISGYTMNIANSYAMAFILSQPGIHAVVLSSEMGEIQIEMTLNAFMKRYGFKPFTYRLVYGKRPVMYIKDAFYHEKNISEMKDVHGNHYEIAYNGTITEILDPYVYRSENTYCDGSYVILIEENRNDKRILEEVYEELYERI